MWVGHRNGGSSAATPDCRRAWTVGAEHVVFGDLRASAAAVSAKGARTVGACVVKLSNIASFSSETVCAATEPSEFAVTVRTFSIILGFPAERAAAAVRCGFARAVGAKVINAGDRAATAASKRRNTAWAVGTKVVDLLEVGVAAAAELR